MRILVCGGRDFPHRDLVHDWLDSFHEAQPVTELIHGGASGVDTYAAEWGRERGLRVFCCKADWEKHGPAAGPIRNARMLEWKPDVVIAFPGGRGTENMVSLAMKAGVIVEIPFDSVVFDL